MQHTEKTASRRSATTVAPSSKLAIGPVLGQCALPDHVVKKAAALAAEFYAAQEAVDWSGDTVETYAEPEWLLRGGAAWCPDISQVGLRRLVSDGGFHRLIDKSELVVSAGTEMHEDHVHGLVLMIVLHNDGLKFRQGRVSHVPKAGDWFIFDDRKPHGVDTRKDNCTFVGWSIPVECVEG